MLETDVAPIVGHDLLGMVGAGSSTFLVSGGPDSDDPGAVAALVDALRARGMFGGHYQECKVVALSSQHVGAAVGFSFHQVLPEGILGGLECANAAAAAAAMAWRWGRASVGPTRCLNLGTGQASTVTPDGDGALICFDAVNPPLHWVDEELEYSGPWGAFPCWLGVRGNAFLLAEADPEDCQDGAIEALLQDAVALFVARGGSPELARVMKLVVFSVEHEDAWGARARVRCWSHGLAHRSVPGSAAMLLARVLAERRVAAGLVGRPFQQLTLAHASGLLTVSVQMSGAAPGEVAWTLFRTRLREEP